MKKVFFCILIVLISFVGLSKSLNLSFDDITDYIYEFYDFNYSNGVYSGEGIGKGGNTNLILKGTSSDITSIELQFYISKSSTMNENSTNIMFLLLCNIFYNELDSIELLVNNILECLNTNVAKSTFYKGNKRVTVICEYSNYFEVHIRRK